MAIDLGSAKFQFQADNAPLLRAEIEAVRATQQNVQKIAAAFKTTEATVNQAFANIAATTSKATAGQQRAGQQIAASNQQAAGSFGNLLSSALAFGAGAAGVQMGAAGIHGAMTKVATETVKADTAQRQITATFGSSTSAYAAYANQLADATNRTTATVQSGVARIGSLQQSMALTSKETQELSKASLNLAAVFGGDVQEAFRSVQAGARGEAEALEKYNIFVQDSTIKTTAAFKGLTAEQQRHWESLDEVTKARVRASAILEQAARVEGEAEKRAASQMGQFDKLKKSTDELSVAIGTRLVPFLSGVAGGFAKATDEATKYLDKTEKLARELGKTDAEAKGFSLRQGALRIIDPIGAATIDRQVERIAAARRSDPVNAIEAQEREIAQALSAAAAVRARDREAEQRRAASVRRDDVKNQLDEAEGAIKKQVDLELDAIDATRKAKERWFDEERQRIEARRTYQLEDIERRRDAEIAGIQAAAQAQKDADQLEIDRAERRKKLDERTIEEATRQANEAIKASQERLEREREQEDREREDARRSNDRQIADARAREDHERETSHRDEMRRLDERHETVMDDLRLEGEAEQRDADRRLRNLDRRTQREDERHRKAVRNIEREEQRGLDAIDAQLRALDAAERGEDNADRVADLQRRVAEAQTGVTRATGTGTPEEIAAARAKLTAAIRIGDPEAEAKARDELAAIAGQGADAIRRANEELASALDDLRDEQTKQARDAERQRLKDAQDAIRRKADEEKQEEDERSRRRKNDIDEAKDTEREKLQDFQRTLERRRRDQQDAHDDAVQLANDEYQEHTRLLGLRREDEDRALADLREAEERERADRRDAEDRDLSQQRARVSANQESMRNDLEAHYNGEQGVLTKLRASSEAHAREFSAQLAAARANFDQQRKDAELIYTNPEGTGLLQNLEQSKGATFDSLEKQKEHWGKWREKVQGDIKEAKKDLDAFIQRVEDLGNGVIRLPGGSPPRGGGGGGGTATPERPEAPPAPTGDTSRTYAPVVRGAGRNSYWTDQGTHAPWPAADIFAETGTPIYAPVGGRLSSFWDASGGNAAIEHGDNGYAYYFAHGDRPFRSGNVRRGDPIGEVGNTGSARNTSPHLHFAIATKAAVFDQRRGKGDVWGDSTYWTAHRYGGIVAEPSIMVSARTGRAWGTIAEDGPEVVHSTSRSAAMLGGGGGFNRASLDYLADRIGQIMARSRSNLTLNGVHPESMFKEADRRAREQQRLRGQVR